jgi:predicted dehydrogenase
VSKPAKVRVGLVGCGYWGSNVARNLLEIAGCELAWCCDVDAARGDLAGSAARFTTDLGEMLADDSLEAVLAATPVATHVEIAERVLDAGKHCFVEKPLAQNLSDAERVTALAAEGKRVLMVGHLLEFHPGVVALKELIQADALGDVHYVYSQRLNLGKLRADENALWSLGAHDVSVVVSLAEETPVEVSARGESFVRAGVEDVVFCHMRFASGLVAHLHLSWLDPHKERRLTVVGSRRMAAFDDMAAERKLTVFDKGFDADAETSDGYVTRSGQAHSPTVGDGEPLRIELEHFLACARGECRPLTDGASGIRVVRVLEAMQRSLEARGASVELGQGSLL